MMMNDFLFCIGVILSVTGVVLLLLLFLNVIGSNNEMPPTFRKTQKKGVKVCIYGDQIIGTRSHQQDYYVITSNTNGYFLKHNGIMCAVCDGMGGMKMGELASQICADTLYSDFTELKALIIKPAELLANAINKADKSISGFTDARGKKLRCGTTAVAAIVNNEKFYWVSVGDSRIYQYENGHLSQITRDHNYLLELNAQVRKGTITLSEAENHPQAEALISYVGMNGIKLLDRGIADFTEGCGRIFVLCSDGLYKALSDAEIEDIFRRCNGKIKLIPKLLLNAVEQKAQYRSLDNTTVIVVGYD